MASLKSFLPLTLLGGLACVSAAHHTIWRDVCVIGGGSGGTYTAIQLQRQNRSVAVVERRGRLGGNVDTYTDPVTDQTSDNGVVVFEHLPVVFDYMSHLGVSLHSMGGGDSTTEYFNFRNSKLVKPSSLPSGNFTAALTKYIEQLNKYPYLIDGYNLPEDIPADLLLPWGQFLKKHDLEALSFITSTYNQGSGYILDVPTLYMIKYLNAGEVGSFTDGFLTTKGNNNQQIYDKAHEKLGRNVFLNSDVTSVKRSARGVQVDFVSGGDTTTIYAKELVIAIRPTLSAVEPWLDLTPKEKSLFAQFNYQNYYCGIVANSGIPANLSLSAADPSQPHAIPQEPYLYSIGATGIRDLHSVYYQSATHMTNKAVQSKILSDLTNARHALGYPNPSKSPEFVFFHAHVPFFLTVPLQAIKNGFYTKLESLQGEKRTHWTGAAWQTEDSSTIWNYTHNVILPQVLTSLGEY